MSKRRIIIDQNEISEVLQVSLGGYEQKIAIEGRTKNLPIVIMLHGGPGLPVPFCVGSRGLFPEFTEHFIMVYWDQLGCGINDAPIDDSFKINNYVLMTIDLVTEIKGKFPQNKLILFATSWGSVLSLKTIAHIGNQIDAAVVWGQIVKEPIYNDSVYKELELAKIPEKDKKLIEEYKQNQVTCETIKHLAGYVQKYTKGYFNKYGKQAPMGPIMIGLLTSPDYHLRDLKAFVINGSAKNSSIWTELISIDLTEELKTIKVPYYILQGDTDIVTNTENVVQLVDNLENQNIHCKVIPNSGHIPGADGMEAALQELLYCAEDASLSD